jgi:peptidoglycan hydrolase-like protein with peptidoglycan-binding domain
MGNAGHAVSLTSKTVRTGIVFTILVSGLLGLSMASFASGSDLNNAQPAVVNQSDVKKIQQVLRDKGHYRGRVDGDFGLRTRAGIRAFQKAENLRVSGKLDVETAGKLGVQPEALGSGSYGSGQMIGQGRKQTSDQIINGKPSAGVKRAKGSGRPGQTQAQIVKPASDTESGQRDREKKLQTENENHPR